MDPQTSDIAQTLCRWAEDVIRNGRSPFRRAESSPCIMTAGGELTPPLVLWVNRDSFMAGAVIFFPTRETAEEELAAGRSCAEALGLRHFVTWGPREVTFWEDQPGKAQPIGSLPLGAAPSPSALETFNATMDRLKLLSVLGAVPPDQLSPYCLVNLCRHARDESLPALAEAFRVGRGEGRPPAREAETAEAALHQGTLVLLRLLALLLEDRLPPAIQPEGLAQAIHFALDALPPSLAAALAETAGECPLPVESAIRFHHLFRRLLQLRFGEDRPRAAHVLELLLKHEGTRLGGFPLQPAEPLPPGSLLLNPGLLVGAAGCIEVAPAPILVFTALLRHLHGLPAPLRQASDLLALPELPPPAEVLGALLPGRPIPSGGRRALAIRLRLSWPHRRFSLPPATPRWAWEFLHLLGLAAPSAALELDTPDGWLTADFGRPLLEVINEQFTIEELTRLHGDRLRCRLRKEIRPNALAVIEGLGGRRTIACSQVRNLPSSGLIFALDLPPAVYTLLERGELTPAAALPGEEWGLYLFSRSSLGRTLWQTAQGRRPLPGRHDLGQLQQHGLPLPPGEILCDLQRLAPPEAGEPPLQALDAALARWCGELPLAPSISSPRPLPSRRQRGRNRVLRELLHAVGGEGLPLFPEHYLYAHYRPELREYRFAPPLAFDEEFFGRFVLRDRLGAELNVEGRETARALFLASFGESRPILLPVEQALTAAILDRYLADLRRLRETLVREAHRRLADSAAADRLIEGVWKTLSLPPWSAVLG